MQSSQFPNSFAEWSDLFDKLKAGGFENELLETAQGGSFNWEPGTAELWAEDFTEVIRERINIAKKRFDRDFSHTGGDMGAAERALIQLKKDLKYAMALTRIPCIPDEQKPLYADLVNKAAEQFSSSLESSARSEDRSGRLSVLVKKINICNLN